MVFACTLEPGLGLAELGHPSRDRVAFGGNAVFIHTESFVSSPDVFIGIDWGANQDGEDARG